MDDKLGKIKIHFFYSTLILLMVIIAITTSEWTLQPKFTEFLSNAATMTSLVLGLIAIFYSFIANDGLSKSLGTIGAVSDEIKSSKEQIVQQVAAGSETTKAAERSALLISSASSSIDSSLTSLSTTLALIQKHTEVLHGSLADLPTRLDNLETKMTDATRVLGPKPEEQLPLNQTKTLDTASIKRFLEKSSVAANLLMYACVLSSKNKKELNLNDFCTAIDSKQLEDYSYGFITCMEAIQIINGSLISGVSDKPRIYSINSIHQYLVDNTKSYLVDFLDRNFKEKNSKAHLRWMTAINNIETLLN